MWSCNTIINNALQSELIIIKKLYMGCFDTSLVRYGTLVIGYGICALPYFGNYWIKLIWLGP